MTAARARIEVNVEAVEAAIEQLREVTRDARAAIKDLRQVEKEVREVLQTSAHDLVNNAISGAVKVGLDSYKEAISRAQDQAFERVGAAFEELATLYMEGSKYNGPSIPELAERRIEAIRSIRRRGPR